MEAMNFTRYVIDVWIKLYSHLYIILRGELNSYCHCCNIENTVPSESIGTERAIILFLYIGGFLLYIGVGERFQRASGKQSHWSEVVDGWESESRMETRERERRSEVGL